MSLSLKDKRTYFAFSRSRRAWKIGFTHWLGERLRDVRRQYKTPDLVLVAVFPFSEVNERDCHIAFAALRLRAPELGKEWFRDSRRIRAFIKQQKGKL